MKIVHSKRLTHENDTMLDNAHRRFDEETELAVSALAAVRGSNGYGRFETHRLWYVVKRKVRNNG
jgi:hypothetical protein